MRDGRRTDAIGMKPGDGRQEGVDLLAEIDRITRRPVDVDQLHGVFRHPILLQGSSARKVPS